MSTPPEIPSISRRDYFAVQFSLKLLRVMQVAPGKVAVPRDDQNTMKIDCPMGVAIQMGDDLGRMLDTSTPAPAEAPLTIIEPEATPTPPAA